LKGALEDKIGDIDDAAKTRTMKERVDGEQGGRTFAGKKRKAAEVPDADDTDGADQDGADSKVKVNEKTAK